MGTKLLNHEHNIYYGQEGFDYIQKHIHPFTGNPDKDFVLGVHSPNDGIVNPADACIALAKRAKKTGMVTIMENTECSGFVMDDGEGLGEGRKVLKVKVNSKQYGEGIEVNLAPGSQDHSQSQNATVVLAASAWMRKLGKQLSNHTNNINAELPLAYAPHQYTIFEKINGVSNKLPVIREFDHKFYCKPEVGGFMLGIFEGQPIPTTPEFIMERSRTGEVPRDVANEVYGEDIEKAGEWFEGALSTIPVLKETGIHRWLNGPDTHSPDHGFCMGPILSLDNVYAASGWNSQGIQCGPGVGVSIAEWILDGYPKGLSTINSQSESSWINHFEDHNIVRFNPSISKNDEWTTYRALECYGGTFQAHWPREQPETVRGLGLKSAFWDRLRQKGGVFGEGYGYERAMYFIESESNSNTAETSEISEPQNEWDELSPPSTRSQALTIPHDHYSMDYKNSKWFEYEKKEAEHCRSKVVAFDMSPFGKVLVKGKQSLSLIDYAVAGKVRDMEVGSILYTCYCNEQTGGIAGDLTVARLDEDKYYCVLPAADDEKFYNHLRRIVRDKGKELGISNANVKNSLSNDDTVSFEKVTPNYASLAIMGPQSRDLLSQAFPATDFSNEKFPFGTVQELFMDSSSNSSSFPNSKVYALRVSFAGELGWELHIENDLVNTSGSFDPSAIPSNNSLPVRIYDHLFSISHQLSDYESDIKFNIDLKDAGMFSLLNTLRIEKGFVHNGHDTHPMVSPQECGLGFCTDMKKENHGFAGQDKLLEKQKNKKLLTKRLVSFRFRDEDEVSPNGHYAEIIYRNGEKVGHLTSAGYSHHLKSPIGLGFVDLAGKEKGMKVKEFLETSNGDDSVSGVEYECEIVVNDSSDSNNVIPITKKVPVFVRMGPLVDKSGKRVKGDYGGIKDLNQEEGEDEAAFRDWEKRFR